MNKQVPFIVVEASRKILAELKAERAELTRPLDEKIAALEEFLSDEWQGALQPVLREGREYAEMLKESLSRQIIAAAGELIDAGFVATTDKVYQNLASKGVQFPEGRSPHARITRILSGSGVYSGHKTRGWTRKGEVPEAGRPLDASGATMSEQDEH